MVEALTIVAGIRQFGLAPDGSDLRDLEVGFADRERQIAALRKERDEAREREAALAAQHNANKGVE